jgi:hypothetical protein
MSLPLLKKYGPTQRTTITVPYESPTVALAHVVQLFKPHLTPTNTIIVPRLIHINTCHNGTSSSASLPIQIFHLISSVYDPGAESLAQRLQSAISDASTIVFGNTDLGGKADGGLPKEIMLWSGQLIHWFLGTNGGQSVGATHSVAELTWDTVEVDPFQWLQGIIGEGLRDTLGLIL